MSPAAPTRASDQEEWISPTLGPGCWLLHHSAQSPDCRVDIKSSSSVKMRLSLFFFLFSSCICSHACMYVCVGQGLMLGISLSLYFMFWG